MIKLLFILLSLFPLSLLAEPDGRVRVSLDSEKEWWVGQRVPVHLELLTTGFSFSGQRFDLPQIEGGVLVQTDTTTVKLSEQIDGESWQILRYDLSLFSQRGGQVDIPSFSVRFQASMGYGQPEAQFDLKTGPLSVMLTLPPGSDTSRPVITSPEVRVTEQWHPDVSEVKAGEALTRTVTLEAKDVSGIALPPIPATDIDGVDLLAKAPVVRDTTHRGDLDGYRQDQVSYLFKRAGSFTLPGGAVSWWNPQQERLETFEYEARQVEVMQNPALTAETPSSALKPSGYRIRAIVFALVAVLLITALGYAFWPGKRPEQDTEALRYKRAVRACKSHDARRAWKAVNAWLNMSRLQMPDSGRDAWEALQLAMVSGARNWSGVELEKIIRQMRREYLDQQRVDEGRALAPLNPRG